ncbi:DUF2269 domain-containing protein [Thioalkalicoccus limnaeus]|uniref:DUF2269 domain-containing protein n=1 Tax=Thioalkalicoccus limnaeus TaxID=120681 RepID=A0ABV4BFN4_9GAMM
MYLFFKTIHILGAALLIGNAIITAFWKIYADRTRGPAIVAFAQRLVTVTDWVFTGSGIFLLVVGGYGMLWVSGVDPFSLGWLFWGQAAFYFSGVIWILFLVPTQIAQARQARSFADGAPVPTSYLRLGHRWLAWGAVSTLPLILAFYMMVAKPA